MMVFPFSLLEASAGPLRFDKNKNDYVRAFQKNVHRCQTFDLGGF